MSETYFARFLWSARQEDVGSCAHHLSSFLSDLGAIDSLFLTWRDGSKSKKEHRLPVSGLQLKRLLEKGVNRRDIGEKVIPELGFAVSLIPGAQNSGFVFRVNCGVYSSWKSNCCSIEFPSEGDDAERIIQASTLVQIARAIIKNWQPQHGVITSHQCSRLVSPESFFQEVGWITYLSEQYGKLLHLSSVAEVEAMESGHLVIVTRERFSSDNPAHVREVMKVSSLLGFKRRV